MNSPSKELEKKFRELSSIKYNAVTDLNKCIGCGTCIKFCPLFIRKYNKNHKAITIKSTRFCGGCSVCYHRCPEQAIKLLKVAR